MITDKRVHQSTVGLAYELGAGIWGHMTSHLELGAELVLERAAHSNGTIVGYAYTSTDLDLLLGVRVR